MSRSRTQIYLLIALLAVFVAVVVVPRGEGPAAPGAPASNGRGGAALPAPPPVVDVKLEALNADRDGPADPTRNLFAFQPRYVPPPPRAESPQPPPDMAPPAPTGPPPPPPIPLKFIGVMEAPGRSGRVAILSDGRGGTFYGREGDTIDGRYKVLKIGTESAELSYVDGRGRQTLRLSGQ